MTIRLKMWIRSLSLSYIVKVEEATDKLATVVLSNENSPPPQHQKLSKAEKRRLKKEQDDLKREEEIRAAEEQNRYGPRNVETQSIKDQLKQRKLAIHEVPSNGYAIFTRPFFGHLLLKVPLAGPTLLQL